MTFRSHSSFMYSGALHIDAEGLRPITSRCENVAALKLETPRTCCQIGNYITGASRSLPCSLQGVWRQVLDRPSHTAAPVPQTTRTRGRQVITWRIHPSAQTVQTSSPNPFTQAGIRSGKTREAARTVGGWMRCQEVGAPHGSGVTPG